MSVFGIVGYLGMHPDTSERLNTFVVGFLTYPEAIAEMPGANVWGVLFATLFIVGLGSAFALLETLVTMVCDTDWGKKFSRPYVSSIIVAASFLISLPFCTEFGYILVDAADTWINYLALFWIVWCEAVCDTTLYRYRDVVDQCGLLSWRLDNIFGYIGGTVIGLVIAHTVSPEAGTGAGLGIFIVSMISSVLSSSDPPAYTPRFFSKNTPSRRFWYLTSYSWKIPAIWGFILKYNTAPIVAIIFSLSYPNFYAKNRMDPLHIAGFAFMHIVLVSSLVGLIMPRWFNVFVPEHKKLEGDYPVMPGIIFSRANAEGTLDIDGMPHNAHDTILRLEELAARRTWHERDPRPRKRSLTSANKPSIYIAAPIAAQTSSESFLYSILPTDSLTPLPTPVPLPTVVEDGCPTATELSLCPSCTGEAPQCVTVSTLTQSCGCPSAAATETFTFGCDKSACPRVGCSTSYTIVSGEEACTGSASVSATAATTDVVTVTTTTQATTAATGSQAGTASGASGSSASPSATPNAAGRLAIPFKFW
ncbi:hypothetical protein CaCOL14_000102 [Colletotrichum acutatum]